MKNFERLADGIGRTVWEMSEANVVVRRYRESDLSPGKRAIMCESQ